MDEKIYSHNRGVICVPKGKWLGAPTLMSPVPGAVPGIQQVLSGVRNMEVVPENEVNDGFSLRTRLPQLPSVTLHPISWWRDTRPPSISGVVTPQPSRAQENVSSPQR